MALHESQRLSALWSCISLLRSSSSSTWLVDSVLNMGELHAQWSLMHHNAFHRDAMWADWGGMLDCSTVPGGNLPPGHATRAHVLPE